MVYSTINIKIDKLFPELVLNLDSLLCIYTELSGKVIIQVSAYISSGLEFGFGSILIYAKF